MSFTPFSGTSADVGSTLNVYFGEIYGSCTFATGKLGIGTAPSVALHVIGAARIEDTSNSTITSLTLAGGLSNLQVKHVASSSLCTLANTGGGGIAMSDGTVRLTINGTTVVPGADNTQTLGSGPLRWSTVYAGTGSINTSDAREKTAISALTTAELAASKRIAAEIGTYHWLEAVQLKGSDARTHIGLTVQRAIEILEDEGLDATAYGFICHDAWEEDGATPAGDRYSFRTDELLMFIARGFEARLAALEAP